MSDIWSLFDKIKKTEKVSGPPEYIIVGLGNPGKDYEKTRHNTGFMAMDKISDMAGVHIDRLKYKALTSVCEFGGKSVLLMKPQTYMNLSGEAVFAAMDFYKIPLDKVIVIYDDTTLEVGKMRIRKKGSAGGHNGIKSIIACCGGDEFPRIKVGIGKKPEGWDLADWVLGKYSEDDLKVLEGMYEKSAEAAKLIMAGKTDEAMNKFN
ncbi:MAG: aminoacyl-tRNA hydrolase [Oscillospiraceae bacterium]|nr:aminoacyl-tRNA hydrolase [Oscillospiraceae bacterium]